MKIWALLLAVAAVSVGLLLSSVIRSARCFVGPYCSRRPAQHDYGMPQRRHRREEILRKRHAVEGYNEANMALSSKPTVRIDFYRTYETVDFFFLSWRSYSISTFRIFEQLGFLNFWYGGRATFEMGEIFDVDDPSLHVVTVPCGTRLQDFALDEARNANRISVAYSRKFEGSSTFGCAVLRCPLGRCDASIRAHRDEQRQSFGLVSGC